MTLAHIQIARTWLDRALEFSWLAAIVVVPLIVLPDSSFVTTIGLPKTASLRILASLAAVAWIGHGMLWFSVRALFSAAASMPVTAPVPNQQSSIAGRITGRFDSPGAWLQISVVALAAVTALSTVLSIDPAVSTWGKKAGTEGYGLYSTAALFVLFFTVAFKLRDRKQLWRLLNVTAGVGIVTALIGIAQSVDFWPVQDSVYANRVSGHSGNPIAYGSLLVVLFPVAVAAVARNGINRPTMVRLWLPLLGVNFVFMYAVALTLSRGPYLGMAVGLTALLVLAAWAVGLRFGIRLTAVTAVSALAVAVLMTLPEGVNITQPTVASSDDAAQANPATPTVGERLATTGTIATRLEIWRAAQQLVQERPAVPGGQGTDNSAVRHLLGYGPDQLHYVVGLTAEPQTFYRTISEAHNDLIHRLVETGWLGLAAFIGVLGAAGYLLLTTLNRARSSRNFEMGIIAVAISAALAGRLIELQVGIAHNSDLVIFWVLLAVAVASPRILMLNAVAPVRSRGRAAVTKVPTRTARLPQPGGAAGYAFALSLALVLTGTLVVTAWQKNANYVRADHELQLARYESVIDSQQAITHFEKAIRLAPDLARYRIGLGDFYTALAETTTNSTTKLALLNAGYDSDKAALAINKLERDTNFHLAESAWNLAVAGDSVKALEAIERYRFLTEIAPQYALVRERLNQLAKIVDASAK